MNEPEKDSASARKEVVSDLVEQAEDLCQVHGHITRVLEHLTFPDWFSDQSTRDNPRKLDFEGMMRCYLYMDLCGFGQKELERRMDSFPYIQQRFGLDRAPRQQTFSELVPRRLSHASKSVLSESAEQIREACIEEDVLREEALTPDVEEVVQAAGLDSEQIQNAVRLATDLGFSAFPDDRASNAKHPLDVFFERQSFLNLSNMTTTSEPRLFEVMSERDEVPHGSTHNRTMKKIASPDAQTTFNEFHEGTVKPEWKRIRETILPAFHEGVENILDEIAGRERSGIRTPVKAAIDITTIPFWPSPFRDEDEVENSEEPVQFETGSGREREEYLKEDYPDMVSGYKDSGMSKAQRGYKFATLTIVDEGTPIVLAIEPVRDRRAWERGDERVERERTSRSDIVEGLLEQAEQHVKIHKLFCDREFDIRAVQDAVDQRDIQYVIGKKNQSTADAHNVAEIIEDTVYDVRIEHAELAVEGRVHKVSIIYLPTDSDDDSYSLFTVNGWVDNHRAFALTEEYRTRWTIENQYKTIKKHFLPQTATKDYRVRFLYFVIGVLLHNVWRLANFVVRDETDGDLGESPPIPAVGVVLRVGKYLLDPGD